MDTLDLASAQRQACRAPLNTKSQSGKSAAEETGATVGVTAALILTKEPGVPAPA